MLLFMHDMGMKALKSNAMERGLHWNPGVPESLMPDQQMFPLQQCCHCKPN